MGWLSLFELLAWLGLIVILLVALFEIIPARYACAYCGRKFRTLNGVAHHMHLTKGNCCPVMRDWLGRIDYGKTTDEHNN